MCLAPSSFYHILQHYTTVWTCLAKLPFAFYSMQYASLDYFPVILLYLCSLMKEYVLPLWKCTKLFYIPGRYKDVVFYTFIFVSHCCLTIHLLLCSVCSFLSIISIEKYNGYAQSVCCLINFMRKYHVLLSPKTWTWDFTQHTQPFTSLLLN